MTSKKCRLEVVLVSVWILFLGVPAFGASGDGKGGAIKDSVSARGWTFYTDGPVRYPPVNREGRTYVGSDDGYLYCLDSQTGKPVWKFRGGPSNRKLIGNGRLISAWAVSGGPAVAGGRVYFAAGTWPFMGVYVHALDAGTGRVIWTNDTSGPMWPSKDVSGGKPRPSFISVAPKGQVAVEGERLAVPCGRAGPAYFDLKTGEFLKFRYARKGSWKGRDDGSWAYPDYDAIAERKKGCFPADEAAREILELTKITDGYCLVLGIGDGRLVEGLIAQSRLRVVAIDPDAKKVDALRRKLDAKGVYGTRAAVHAGDPLDFGLPPYVASLIVSGDLAGGGFGSIRRFARTVFHSLRPYGGVACLPVPSEARKAFADSVKQAKLENARLDHIGKLVTLTREGALVGSDDWSHEQANPGNTYSTRDRLVKAPLGVLWYGGPAGDIGLYYENHRQRGFAQVAGGRMFVEGPKLVSAFDVYTGRKLWKWSPPAGDGEKWYESRKPKYGSPKPSMVRPLAGRITSSEDAVYVISDKTLHALDAGTGRPLAGFTFAQEDNWGSAKVIGDMLYLPTNTRVVAVDRHSGEVRWTHDDSGGTLAGGKGRLFCLETPSTNRFETAGRWDMMKRRGKIEKPAAKLVALDPRTGAHIWRVVVKGGPRLAYSADHDVLLIPMRGAAYSGKDGSLLWEARTTWDAVVHTDTVLPNNGATFTTFREPLDLLTGKRIERPHPLTGQMGIWKIKKTGHGCDIAIAGENIRTFRSGSAGYVDMINDCGIVNLGAFKSGCCSSLIPADGVLASPLYASYCTCSYPIWTALAMIHAPEMEMWGTYGQVGADGVVRSVGINFGAPGDRRAANGTLWLDYPSVGGASPDLPIRIDPEGAKWYRRNASRIVAGDGVKWVAASGGTDLRSVTIGLNVKTVKKEEQYTLYKQTKTRTVLRIVRADKPAPPRDYVVRLHFADPSSSAPGQRVFDVSIQGEKVLADFDIVAESGGPNRTIVKEFNAVRAGDELCVEFTPKAGVPLICGIEVRQTAPTSARTVRR